MNSIDSLPLKVQLTSSNLDPPIWYLTQICADNTGLRQNNLYPESHEILGTDSSQIVSTELCKISNGWVQIWPNKLHLITYDL